MDSWEAATLVRKEPLPTAQPKCLELLNDGPNDLPEMMADRPCGSGQRSVLTGFVKLFLTTPDQPNLFMNE